MEANALKKTQYRIPIQTGEISDKQLKIKTQVDGNKLCFSLTKVILPESKKDLQNLKSLRWYLKTNILKA